ncbi:outer membrane protein [Bartonella sp. DGB1]|uniref:outer membrane protein n=1 Tax=Bartonella sp. DGB1 TaxID=3239807 RepID=UPI003526BDD1
MKLKYLSYILLGSVFSMSQVSATTVSKKTYLPKASASKVLNNKKNDDNWSGFYLGAADSFAINRIKNPSIKSTITTKKDGSSSDYETKELGKSKMNSVNSRSLLTGLFLGYNHAITEQIVVGAELDIYAKLTLSHRHYKGASEPKDDELPRKIEHIELPLNDYLDGTLRARLGWNLGDFLPYVAGGINAVYDLPEYDIEKFAKNKLTQIIDRKDKLENIITKVEKDNNLHFGWTLGAGFEYKLDKNTSIRAEIPL